MIPGVLRPDHARDVRDDHYKVLLACHVRNEAQVCFGANVENFQNVPHALRCSWRFGCWRHIGCKSIAALADVNKHFGIEWILLESGDCRFYCCKSQTFSASTVRSHRSPCSRNGEGLTMRVSNVRIEEPRPPRRAFRFQTPF